MSTPPASPTPRRKILRIIGFVALGEVFLALGALDLVGRDSVQSQQQAAQLAASLQGEMNRLATAADDTESLEPIERRPIVPQTRGEYGEVERLMPEFFDQMAAQSNDYAAELKAIGVFSLLDPQRIGNDPTLVESRAMLDKAKAVVRRYEKMGRDYMAGMQARIDTLALSAASRRAVRADFERGLDDALGQFGAVWDLEMQAVLEMEKIIDVLAAVPGQWWVQDGQLAIAREEDRARVNAHFATIGRIVAQQEQIRWASLEQANREFGNMATGGAGQR